VISTDTLAVCHKTTTEITTYVTTYKCGLVLSATVNYVYIKATCTDRHDIPKVLFSLEFIFVSHITRNNTST